MWYRIAGIGTIMLGVGLFALRAEVADGPIRAFVAGVAAVWFAVGFICVVKVQRAS